MLNELELKFESEKLETLSQSKSKSQSHVQNQMG